MLFETYFNERARDFGGVGGRHGKRAKGPVLESVDALEQSKKELPTLLSNEVSNPLDSFNESVASNSDSSAEPCLRISPDPSFSSSSGPELESGLNLADLYL